MKKDYISAFLLLAVFTVITFGLNFLLYFIPDTGFSSTDFIYPLPVTYIFFFICSVIIIEILVFISGKNKEQLGYAFLFLTGGKMALCYAFARPIINKATENSTEKINFFVIFILFLIIEAYYTARLLNKK